MNQSKKIRWLYDQLPNLIDKGIISTEVAQRLEDHYGEVDDRPAYQMGFVIAAVLGAVLVGGGIILIFAYNWEYMSIGWRTFFSFLPLVVAQCFYGYTFFKKNDNLSWIESTSAFLMLMLASSIALISQTYNLSGSIEGFLLLWMLLSLPLLYMLNSSLVAIFYLMGISSWAVNTGDSYAVFYWLLLLGAVPHLYRNMAKGKQESNRAMWLGWTFVIICSIAYFAVIENNLLEYYLLGAALWLGLFYFLGLRFYNERARWARRPFQTFGGLCIFIFSFSLCYDWPRQSISFEHLIFGRDYLSWAALTNFGIWLGVLFSYLYLAATQFQKVARIHVIVGAFPVMVLIGALLVSLEFELGAIILANIYLLAIGIHYILNGIKTHQMAYINLGMLLISAQIIIRFFATDFGPLLKGIIFVLLGLSFLAANYIFSKRLDKKS